MTKIHISNICRANILPEILGIIKGPGKTLIPKGLMAPRQIRLLSETTPNVPVTLKWHRDTFVPTILRDTAHQLVLKGHGTYEPQYLLIYGMTDYLTDPDVQANQTEYHAAQQSDATLVVVAIIGESRSCLSVCRNIVSGCQKLLTIQEDARGAVEASNVFLIED